MTRGRQKLGETGGIRASKNKRSVSTHQFRLDVVLFFIVKSMGSTLDKFFSYLYGSQLQTKRTSIYLCRKQNDMLLQLCNSLSLAKLRKIRAVGTGSILPADAAVHIAKWVNAYRTQGIPVSF
ncbi:hypothetical protein GN244_ATG00027 [Phytophthora infestans]|uniref:Uncharacterized protein n=1 Tax=Phytophthora infestans TaxID=4787 RepID=A0A833TIA1_PHYIN|nr:hypothetical protein GN244_ATG00027 [Phytophthora infestans]